VVISIIGIIACLVGIVGGWVINSRLTNSVENLLNGVQQITVSVEGSLEQARVHLNTANSAISTIRHTASQLGAGADVNTPLLDRITQTIQDGLSPALSRIRDAFLPIKESVLAINNTLEVFNTIPGLNLPTLTSQLESLSDRIDQVNQSVADLQASIANFKAGVISNVLTAFMEKFEPIANLLSNLEQDVTTALDQINKLQASVERLQGVVASAIDIITLLLSIWLVWIALSQVSLVLVARYYLKSGKMVWEANEIKTHPAETTLEAS
jgi:chromosome segregation ATPase